MTWAASTIGIVSDSCGLVELATEVVWRSPQVANSMLGGQNIRKVVLTYKAYL